AGSGKTTELVGRMVALVESGTATVDEIAAVTFTRKAASELRERFQMRLEERLASARAGDDERALAAERLARAVDDIDRAFVGTIHAFCARLLREYPLEVGLDPAFEELPVEERIDLRRRFWQSHLERLTRESAPVLEDLARAGLRPALLYPLFERLVENPDVDFPADTAEPGSPEEVAAVRAELESLVDQAMALMPERVPEKDWDSLQKKMRTLAFTRSVNGWREPADFYDALASICKQGARGHTTTYKRWKDSALAKAFLAKVNAFAWGDTPANRLLERWWAHRYALAIGLAADAAREFEAYRLRAGRLDFQDLLVLTAKLLREQPWVRRALGERYRRLLVDEFQDTDPLQAEIMLLLASDPGPAAEADEGSGTALEGFDGDARAPASPVWRDAVPRPGALFVVGDPKQSIYRFRRADIQLYALVKERFTRFGEVVELTTNFRSRPAIGDLVNELFRTEGFLPPSETEEQAAFEPLNTRPPEGRVSCEGVFVYDLRPSRRAASAAAADDAARLSSWIRARVDGGERRPGDFLVLTRWRSRLDIYARALEAYGLPVEVTGAGVGVEEELRELEAVLECMIDPGNPVRVTAVLVGLFFGLDYERLLAHRLDGGGFDAMRPGRHGHEDVLSALRELHGWWREALVEPADVFVARLVSRLGLLPYAAAGELGSLRAGALVYALDAVRAAALAGDASLPGALAALRAALELSEAEAPLEPSRPDVVRLMNLHQAKGLEAPVVVLADPCGGKDRPPDLHVSRSESAAAVGHLVVREAGEGFKGDRILARPPGWDALEERERRFDAAEEVRLLYVAVTRAAQELVVARWPEGRDDSPWRALHPWLERRATVLELEPREPEPRARVERTVEEIRSAARAAGERVAAAARPTWVRAAVTDVAEGAPAEAAPPPEPPAERPLEGFRGYSWGSAVHGALAAAAAGADGEALRATCRDLLVEHDRPLDDHGDPVELEELIALVRRVEASELWTRARRAERMLAEVPFAAPRDAPRRDAGAGAAPAGRGAAARRQLDLFGAEAAAAAASPRPAASGPAGGAGDGGAPDEPLVVLEGVIDLVFREPDGWVVVDYKTDVGTDPDFGRRRAAYRRQVELYAEAWGRLTGEPVKERALFFTSQGRVERW
ncbi:MAG TPA: UvrD-helicase domain-containing protein, partial [Longimicrobiales bacterium]|nr:UvrD-helicase domain-containing protein [Longimicrobiales bacterium]